MRHGTKTRPENQPFHEYIAAVYYNNNIKCVAAVVSLSQLLTLAECIKSPIVTESVEELNKYFAKISLGDDINAEVPYYFQQVEVHPHYPLNGDNMMFNIGVITVNNQYVYKHFYNA